MRMTLRGPCQTFELYYPLGALVQFCFYAGTLDPRITFTRASNGFYRNSSGTGTTAGNNAPRFEYDNNGNAIGLLIEESRQNVLTYSQDLANWPNTWEGGVTMTSNNAVAPDGTTTADKIESINSTNDGIHKFETLSLNTQYTASVWLRNDDATVSRVLIDVLATTTVAEVVIAWSGGVPSTQSSTGASNIVYDDWGGGWYRVSFVFTSNNTTASHNFVLNPGYTGSTLGTGAWAWGSQLEPGSFVTSYIKTPHSSAVTRAADVAQITGTNFTDWFNNTEGTFILDADGPPSGVDARITLSDGTSTERVAINRAFNNEPHFFSFSAGGADASVVDTPTDWINGTSKRVAVSYRANDWAMSYDGRAEQSDNTGVVPSGMDRLEFSDVGGAGGYWNGHIRSLTYLPVHMGGVLSELST